MAHILEGKLQSEIARELGMSENGVSNIVRSPIFQRELTRRRVEQRRRVDEAEVVRLLNAHDLLDGAAAEAARQHVSLLHSSKERIRQISAMDILDRAGYPKVSKSESRSVDTQLVISEKQLARMQRASLEAFGKEMEI